MRGNFLKEMWPGDLAAFSVKRGAGGRWLPPRRPARSWPQPQSLEVYSLAIKREKEAELLYIGRLYREAIKQYYLSSPGSVQKYPASLEDLRKDPRSLVTRRYLRRLYPDPITGKAFAVIAAP